MTVLLIFFGIAAALAVIAFLVKLGSNQRARKVAGWPTAKAMVTSTDIIEQPAAWSRYMPWITYSYEVSGKPYEGDRIRFGGRITFSSERKALAFLERFPVQKHATVYYDPRRPNVAILDPTPYSVAFIAILLIAVIFAVIAVLVGALTLLTK